MNAPTITVIVPVYKVEPYLRRCVDSILAQTFTDFELILVDDGSPDVCPAICDEYAAQDSRVRVIHKENGGVSSARNAGIDAAKGEYIAFVDSDDIIDKYYIECLYNTIIDTAADMSICSFIRVQGENYQYNLLNDFTVLFDKMEDEQKLIMYKLAKYFLVYGPFNKLLKTSIVRSNNILFDESDSFGEDLLFVFAYLSKSKSISYVSKALYYYYDNPGSLLHRFREDRFENSLKINGAVREFFEKHDCFIPQMRKELAQRVFWDGYSTIIDLFQMDLSHKLIKARMKYIITHSTFHEAALITDAEHSLKRYAKMMKKGHFNLLYYVRSFAIKIKSAK